MSIPSPSLDDLLFDALTLRPFLRTTSTQDSAASEPLPFLTADAQLTEVPQAQVRPLTPLEARERLERLMAQPEVREQLMLQLGQVVPDKAIFQEFSGLLGARDAGEFTQAMTAWTGTDQPEALEQQVQGLTKNMQEALKRLQNGPFRVPYTTAPQTTQASTQASTQATAQQKAGRVSPLLLGFLALSQVAQPGEVKQERATAPAPPVVPLPAVRLNFSKGNLERVLGRKTNPDS